MLLSQKQSAINSKTTPTNSKRSRQANNDLQFAQTELTNLQGQLDAIPAKTTSGWSESSGQSITIEFDQSIFNNGDDLFSLINNNSLSVYIDGLSSPA